MHTFLIAVLLCSTGAAYAADTYSPSNPPGPHAVGMKVVQQYDRSRLYRSRLDLVTGEPVTGERARPIQALVWYPAVPATGGKLLTFRDYMDTVPSEDNFAISPVEAKRLADKRVDEVAGTRRDALLRDISRPLAAARDAGIKDGKYPVIIYAPGYSGSAIENVDLCEYLASKGYIVLSSASMGTRTRAMTVDLEGVETQAGDISYLIGYAATLPQADVSRVGVVGFSWGGLANVFAASRDERIRAIVSLDGSLRGSSKFVDGGKEAARYVTPARVAVPLMYLGARPKTVEDLNSSDTPTTYSFMNEMKYSDVYIVTNLPMTHGDFSSYAIRTSRDTGFGDYTRDDISLAHSWVVRYAGHFLDAYLKNDSAGLKFINNAPAANQVPPHTMLSSVRRNQAKLAPTLENFVQRLKEGGFDKAIPVYDQMNANGDAFKLGINEAYSWGLQLNRLNRPVEAREILRLATHMHPKHPYLASALAEMQAKTGQAQEALATYRRVLVLDPNNTDANKYVKQHGAL